MKNNPKQIFMSLNVKRSLALFSALLVTIFVYFITSQVENVIAEYNYKTPKAIERNVGQAYDDLQKFIRDNRVTPQNNEILEKWVKSHKYTYLYIYDNQKSAFEGGWRVDDMQRHRRGITPSDQRKFLEYSKNGKDNMDSLTQEQKINYNAFKGDVQNRIVNFSDGPYYVYIDVYREEHWHQLMAIIKILLSAITFIAIIIWYNGRELKRIINLSHDVEKITDGDFYAPIKGKYNDEIGRLADNVNFMRDAVLEKLKNEQEAWDANTQLITAMSHDIRTPLTSLIGYLDIIEGQKYHSVEELNQYISSCRDKAFQLKDLSDKLFQYFLVFGSHNSEKHLQAYDASILLEQIISEHTAELINYGFKIEFEYMVENSEIYVDISGIQRLFDNLFSNIMKYGDKRFHVSISVVQEETVIVIRLLNSILESSKKVESNKIGLKSCEIICADMNGHFSYRDEGTLFTASISIPIHHIDEL